MARTSPGERASGKSQNNGLLPACWTRICPTRDDRKQRKRKDPNGYWNGTGLHWVPENPRLGASHDEKQVARRCSSLVLAYSTNVGWQPPLATIVWNENERTNSNGLYTQWMSLWNPIPFHQDRHRQLLHLRRNTSRRRRLPSSWPISIFTRTGPRQPKCCERNETKCWVTRRFKKSFTNLP